MLKRIANVLYSEPSEYKTLLQKELKKGISYPAARSNCLKTFLEKEFDTKTLESMLLEPNTILAIEYLKALLHYDSPMLPCAIKRIGGDYHSTYITNHICSATGIREMLFRNELATLEDVVPPATALAIQNELVAGKGIMSIHNFEKELLLLIRRMSASELSKISDVTEGLENVLKKATQEAFSIDSMIQTVKSKRYTQTRIQRILIHILLGIQKEWLIQQKDSLPYARILAYSEKGKKLLPKLAKESKIPIVTSVHSFMKNATVSQKQSMELDILATNLYTLGYQIPTFREINLDYTKSIQKVDLNSYLPI